MPQPWDTSDDTKHTHTHAQTQRKSAVKVRRSHGCHMKTLQKGRTKSLPQLPPHPDTFSLNICQKKEIKADLTLGAERCGSLNRKADAVYTTPERMQANQRQDSRDLAAMFFRVSAQCSGSDRLLSSSVAAAESQGRSSCSAAPADFTSLPPLLLRPSRCGD